MILNQLTKSIGQAGEAAARLFERPEESRTEPLIPSRGKSRWVLSAAADYQRYPVLALLLTYQVT